MKTLKSNLILAVLGLAFVPMSARAQWNQSASVGPFVYTDPANWVGGIINNVFTNPAPLSGLTLTFTNDFILTNGVLMNFTGSSNVIFQSDSATPRTLHLSLGNFLRTNQNGGTITIGTTNNPLVLDLFNSTRTIGGAGSGSLSFGDCIMNVYAKITDLAGGTNGVNLALGRVYTYLLNDNNDFVGPVTFAGLRGGGFTSIKNIGAGPSAMGAPTDLTSGTATIVDNTSFGHLDYLGSGDTTDRPFVWNLSGAQYSFQNLGSGKITFNGTWSLPFAVNRTNFMTINAASNHIEFDGMLKDGIATTNVVFKGNYNTNRIVLTCSSNNFRGIELTNVVLAYNNIADAGLPCALGTNGIIVHRGNSSTSAGGASNPSGQGASLQYFGPTTNFTRTLQLSGTGYNWGIDNAGTNTTLTFTTDFVGASTGSGSTPRFLWLNPNALTTTTNFATLEILGAIPDAGPLVATTVEIAAPAGFGGSLINNGGIVRLLNPTNSFSGGIRIRYARTAQVMTLADGGLPCSIGTGSSPIGGGATSVILGSTDSQRGGTLAYIGTTDASCNRQITVQGTAGGLSSATIINNSPNNSSLHLSDPGFWTMWSTLSNCFVNLGGSAVATNVLDSSIGNPPLGNGNLTINGSTWVLNGTYLHMGYTAISNGGTLWLQGTLGNNPSAGVVVGKNGILGGTGVISDNVTVLTNGAVAPGTNLIGTLTINGSLTNSGTIAVKIKASDGTCDQIVGLSTLVYGGILAVNNLAGTVTNGASFHLFSAANYQGTFASVTPATPGPGLAWDLSGLSSGTLKVTAGAVAPPHIGGITLAGSSVILSGSGGSPGGGYSILTSTNVALALSNWTRISSNYVFDGSGNFNVTNPASGSREFFRIQVP